MQLQWFLVPHGVYWMVMFLSWRALHVQTVQSLTTPTGPSNPELKTKSLAKYSGTFFILLLNHWPPLLNLLLLMFFFFVCLLESFVIFILKVLCPFVPKTTKIFKKGRGWLQVIFGFVRICDLTYLL